LQFLQLYFYWCLGLLASQSAGNFVKTMAIQKLLISRLIGLALMKSAYAKTQLIQGNKRQNWKFHVEIEVA